MVATTIPGTSKEQTSTPTTTEEQATPQLSTNPGRQHFGGGPSKRCARFSIKRSAERCSSKTSKRSGPLEVKPRLLKAPESSSYLSVREPPKAFFIQGTIIDPLLQDEPFPALVLVDSSATTSAIDQKTVERYHLPTVELPFPTKAINADGTENQSGYITQTCPINVQIGSFQFF